MADAGVLEGTPAPPVIAPPSVQVPENLIQTAGAPAERREKLSPEARREAVQAARAQRYVSFFTGQKFVIVGPVKLQGDQRYTDVSGNKGKKGFLVRNVTEGGARYGEETIIGPGSLDKGAFEFDAFVAAV